MTGLDLRVVGAEKLKVLGAQLKAAGNGGLGRELDRGLRAAAGDIQTEIAAHTDEYMPKGYEAVFSASLEFKTEIRKAFGHRVTLVATAKGAKGHPRQVANLERGEIKHPVYGRYRKRRVGHARRNQWVPQRIRAHWFTEPGQRATPAAVERMNAALDRVAAKIARMG